MRASPLDPADRCVVPASAGCGDARLRVCRPKNSDATPRRRETGSVRLRNGVIGLVATVALVALAWQTWSAEQQTGPVSLLDLELGQGGGYRVHEDPKDLITAEVRGLSHVRQKLGVALGSLHKANKFGAPPGVQVRCCGRVRRWRAYAVRCSPVPSLSRPKPLRGVRCAAHAGRCAAHDGRCAWIPWTRGCSAARG